MFVMTERDLFVFAIFVTQTSYMNNKMLKKYGILVYFFCYVLANISLPRTDELMYM